MIAGYKTVTIENVYPELDCGSYPVKREVGELFEVQADIFKEGHDVLAAVLKYRKKTDTTWHETPMWQVENDRWTGSFLLTENTRYVYTIEAWMDVFASWRQELRKKFAAGQDIATELLEGQALIRQARDRAAGEHKRQLDSLLKDLAVCETREAGLRIALGESLARLMEHYPDRSRSTVYDRELEMVVDRVQARYGAWYELFPRSQGKTPGKSGTLRDCEARLPEIHAMGFEVLYLAPIYPIGRSYRKGPNNTLQAGPNDPGSPWAIGNELGGHTAIDPALGTLTDFAHLVHRAQELGIAIALDFALQCSPDHPYVREHPEWFFTRPDGTIKYAENPPKRYQDVYPLNFSCDNYHALWEEAKRILLFWIAQGVKIFRVDNPHTKPIHFWEWLIAEIQQEYPDVIFLSEAFTRPKVMQALAKVGFTQSYTYFTWRNFKEELTAYLTELTQSEAKEYLRGNLFTNTPDILPPILQEGGRPAFKMRLALAATLSSVYGIYSGYELCEHTALPGTEEYLHSEKYEYKVWDWDRPGHIKDYIATINRIRRENPALHLYKNLSFYQADDDNILFYGKLTPVRDNVILVAVNLDPFQAHEAKIHIPLAQIGIDPDKTYEVQELITETRYLWRGAVQTIRLDPQVEPASIFLVKKWAYKDYEDPCY